MALSQPNKGAYLPTALNTLTTLFTDTTGGLKRFWIDDTNLPAGTILNYSVQVIFVSGGAYQEVRNVSISNAVAIPAAPSLGYEPLLPGEEWLESFFGYQVQAQIISGSLPTVGLNYAQNSIS